MSDLLRLVEKSIVEKRLFQRSQSILVAVSGGMDSMVLLHVLHRLAGSSDWKLVVAHFNHQLRGLSSDEDERFVQEAATDLDLTVVSGRGAVKTLQQKEKLSLEMAARRMRHDFLAETASQLGINTVALAHHADDQVELFFLRLLRGSGGLALGGMRWMSPSPSDIKIRLARPLLGQSKSGLQDFAENQHIPFRRDATNELLDIQRNRIRHKLLPDLIREYQSALPKITLRLMDILGANAEYIAQVSHEWLRKKGRAAFDRLPMAIQRECLHSQLVALEILPDFELIERLRCSPGKSFTIGPQVAVLRDKTGRIRLKRTELHSFSAAQATVDLSVGQGRIWFENVEIAWGIISGSKAEASILKQTALCEYFDANKVGSPISLRHWQPGDRFQPIGLKRPVKLQDLFINRKIPRSERHKLLVGVTAGNELFWVEGLRMSEPFKLDKQTAQQLKWEWWRQNGSAIELS